VDKSEPRLDRHADEEPSPQEYDEFLAEAKTLSCNSSNGNGDNYRDRLLRDRVYLMACRSGSVHATSRRVYFN
jgi:hypothetical protein